MPIEAKQIKDPLNVGLPINAFGRVEVALPVTQEQLKQTSPILFDLASEGQVSGSGTSSDITNLTDGATTLTVGTAIGLRRLSSQLPSLYQNGKAFGAFFTFNFLTLGQTGVTKRVGYFDNLDGIFIRQNGTEIGLELRSSTGASAYRSRANWDNPCNDPSKPNEYVDFTYAPIMFVTFQYLGQGQVKIYFLVNGNRVLAHTFNPSNTLTVPYWRTPNLFLRYEIERTIAGGISESLRTVCATTVSEGTTDIKKYPIYIESFTSRSIGALNQIRPLILFRLNPLYINSRVSLKEIIVTINSNAIFIARIIKNPDLGAFVPTWVDYPSRSVQYQLLDTENITIANTVLNNNQVLSTIYTNATTNIASKNFDEAYYLSVQYNNVPDIFALTVITTTANEVVDYRFVHLAEEV
jgi:hypothetical protein